MTTPTAPGSRTIAAASSIRVHPVDETLPASQLAVYGLQHVLAFYAGAILTPIILAGALGLSSAQLIHLINADLFTCGIASLLQSVGIGRIGVRLPLLQGVTITAVGPMVAIGLDAGGGVDGLLAIYGSVIVAGVFTFFAASYFKKLMRFFPPVVVGSIIMIIGISLLPVAANYVVAGSGLNAMQNPVLLKNVLYGAGVLILIIGIQRFFSGFLQTIAVLIGLVAGTFVAWLLGDAHFGEIATANWFGYTSPFYFGWPTFGVTAILSMLVVMLITMVETAGDVYATGEIVKKRIRDEDIARAIRADGVATFIGGVLNAFPYTCFAQNVGLVRLTQVKSRWVVAAAGLIMILLGSLPKVAALVAGIPAPVLGGAALAMFGAVAAVGVQMLGKIDFNNQNNVVIVSISVGLAVLVTAQPFIIDAVPGWAKIFLSSGIILGAVSAILLNFLFGPAGARGAAVAGRPGDSLVTLYDVNQMDDVEFHKAFGGLFENADWVVEGAFAMRPFADTVELRSAFQNALLTGSSEEQLQLLKSFDDFGSDEGAGNDDPVDHTHARNGDHDDAEHDEVRQLAEAYRGYFGFPLIVSATDAERYEQVLASGRTRLANSFAVERASALVQVAAIANHRFDRLVADANPRASALATIMPPSA